MQCHQRDYIDQPYDPPDSFSPQEEPDEPSDLDGFDLPDADDETWDVFIPDDDEFDPQPDPHDFEGIEPGAWSEESE
jgi:hypothetical protein